MTNMRLLIPVLALATLAAQNPNTAVYPTTLATDEDLLVASDRASTTLSSSISAAATSIPVTTATRFTPPMVITIGSEQIKICSKSGNTLTVCTGGRGFAGTTAASAQAGTAVYGNIVAHHVNQLAAELKAVQTALGTGFSGPNHTHNASAITAGTIDPARLGSGTPSAANYLRGDGTWAAVAGGGGTWGSITGTLSSQTDLQSALNGKLATGGTAAAATALAANPADCSANQFATAIAANGDLTCAQVAYSQVSGTPALATVATSGSASDLSAGTLAAARGGAGTVNGILKANGSGTVSAATAGTDYAGLSSSNTWTGSNTFGGATSTVPMKVATSDPSTCTVGEFLYRSDTESVKLCDETDVWRIVLSPPGSSFLIQDEFCGTATAQFDLNWTLVGNGNDTAYDASSFDRPCVTNFNQTGANGTAGLVLRFHGTNNNAAYGVMDGWTTKAGYEFIFIFRTEEITQTKFRVGLTSAISEAQPNDGIFIEFNNNTSCTNTGSDSTWKYYTRASSVSSSANGPTVTSYTWYKARIRSKTAGTWLFSVSTNGGAYSAEQSLSTNVPTAKLAPFFMTVSCDANYARMWVDYFSARAEGLTR